MNRDPARFYFRRDRLAAGVVFVLITIFLALWILLSPAWNKHPSRAASHEEPAHNPPFHFPKTLSTFDHLKSLGETETPRAAKSL